MIGDDLRADLPELRAQAESLMTATGTIARKTGEVLNRETNQVEPTYAAPVYTGKMRVWRSRASSVADVAGQMVTTYPMLCAIPHHVAGVEPDMVVVLTASEDPALINRPLTVADASRHEQSVRRLLTLVDDQG